MKALITGGGGFVAAAAARHLLDQGWEVVAADSNLDSPHLTALQEDFASGLEAVALDVTDRVAAFRTLKSARPDALLHLAAVLGAEDSTAMVDAKTAVNVVGSINVLDAALAAEVPRAVVASTIAVLGSDDLYRPEELPLGDEATPRINPLWPLYGAGKLYLEAAAQWYTQRTPMDVRAIRPATVYGPGRLTGLTLISDVIGDALDGRTDGPELPDIALSLIYQEDIGSQFAELVQVPVERLGDRIAFNSGGDTATMGHVVAIVEELLPGARLSHRLVAVEGTDRHFGFPVSFDGAAIDAALGHPRRHSPLRSGIETFVARRRLHRARSDRLRRARARRDS